MKTPPRFSRRPAAFTLIELLVVIAIIAILAALLLPVLSTAMQSARKARAKTEAQTLVNAIEAYDSAYGRLPVSVPAQQQAANNAANGGNPDFTYGGTFVNNGATTYLGTSGTYTGNLPYNNAEVIAILMDMTAYPSGLATCNTNNVKNPKQTVFLNAHLSGYNPATMGPQGQPGVDVNGVYRDPWGNPYIITMDLNYDGECQDVVYCTQAVSQNGSGSASGYNGLFNPTAIPNSDNFLYRGKAMVWSFGPDGKYSNGVSCNLGVNQDNVLSWK